LPLLQLIHARKGLIGAMVADVAGRRRNVPAVRRVVCTEYGSPRGLTLVEEPDPVAGPGEVVVAVEAAGVNYADALLVAGRYQIKIPPPFTPGMELAGTVAALGPDVAGVAVGDRVFASAFGAFASHAVVPAGALTPVPETIDLDRAAGLVTTYGTMWFSLTRRTTIEPGETVLVLGAGGGVGLAAVDVAVALGARVIAAASSTDKLEVARSVGATDVIDYSTEDLKTRAKELSGGGVDVVVDPVGGDYAEAALRATGWEGRFLVLGFAAGIPKLPANLALLNNRTLIGVDWGAWARREPDAHRDMLAELLAAVGDGRLHPPAPRREPLSDAGAVLQAALDRQLVGKTVLVP
jgi:NADPH2:quinone reductase